MAQWQRDLQRQQQRQLQMDMQRQQQQQQQRRAQDMQRQMDLQRQQRQQQQRWLSQSQRDRLHERPVMRPETAPFGTGQRSSDDKYEWLWALLAVGSLVVFFLVLSLLGV